MKPWMWYAYGILPMQSLPMNVSRYITTGHKPTAGQLAAGFAGSTAVSYGLGYLIHPNIPQAMAYHKLRMLGFGIPGIHPGREVVHGMVWRMPLWMRGIGYGWAAYGVYKGLQQIPPSGNPRGNIMPGDIRYTHIPEN